MDKYSDPRAKEAKSKQKNGGGSLVHTLEEDLEEFSNLEGEKVALRSVSRSGGEYGRTHAYSQRGRKKKRQWMCPITKIFHPIVLTL